MPRKPLARDAAAPPKYQLNIRLTAEELDLLNDLCQERDETQAQVVAAGLSALSKPKRKK